MEKTLNQLMRELSTIATEHRQINEFFQGDFIDAVNINGDKMKVFDIAELVAQAV